MRDLGRDPHDTAAIWRDLWIEVNPTGHKGVTIAAMSTLDVACWDVVGRAAALPLHKIFGACHDSLPTLRQFRFVVVATLAELAAEATRFVDAGFVAIKLRIGSDDIDSRH